MRVEENLLVGINPLENEQFMKIRSIFGSQSNRGDVIFYDALPNQFPTLVTEIMNSHFSKYYSEEEEPHDAQSPIPITFLAIPENIDFVFGLGLKKNAKDENIQEAVRFLKKGLIEYGIGGKTSSGFGIFGEGLIPEPIVDITKPDTLKKYERE